MGRFASYDTTDGTSQPLEANQSITIGPIQTGVASKVAGSVYSDQGGVLIVQQSFDGGNNWDIANTIDVEAATVNSGIDVDVIAPTLQFTYTNGGTNQETLRIFVRVFGSDRAS
jgi:hypothetical protein